MKKIPVIFLVLWLFTGCSIANKCEDYNCMTPPPPFFFEIVDASTGENLYTNGILDPDDIELRNENNQLVQHTYISENELNVIHLHIGWTEGPASYRLILGPEFEIPVSVNSEKRTEDCCTFYRIHDFSTSPYEHEQSSTTGIYHIRID